jgi:hypothetical protein
MSLFIFNECEGKFYTDTGREIPDPDFFGDLGPMNTVADFVAELNDSFFRDILGDETMDRALGSFKQDDLFRVMARIFLNTGFERWAMKS